MAEITVNATEVKEYRDGTLQTGETIRMGTQYSGSGSRYWNHDVVIALDLPKSIKTLSVKQTWRGHQSGSTSYEFSAAITQENRTTAPGAAEATYKFSSGHEATITFKKKLKKGRWYLWLWRHNINAPSFVYGARGTYPQLAITGVAADGGHVFINGAWKDAAAKVYRNGAWEDAAPKEYKNGWSELA